MSEANTTAPATAAYFAAPWWIGCIDRHIVCAGDGTPCEIALCVDGRPEATAAFIVRVVNAHDDLVAACKAWLDYFHELRAHEDPLDRVAKIRDSFHAKRIEMTRLAVAKAEDKQP